MPKAASSHAQSLASSGMRRVVGGDDVDRAVGEAGAQRLDILGRAAAAG